VLEWFPQWLDTARSVAGANATSAAKDKQAQ
jgi:hypothetical protein